MSHKSEPRTSLEDLFHDIEDLVGPQEAETPEEKQKRLEIIDADRKRRQKRKAEGR